MGDIDIKEYFEREIKLLKEFINEKFVSMQVQQKLTMDNLKEDIGAAHNKIRAQDERIKIIETHVALKKQEDSGKVSVWKKIQESFWGWLVPFILMALLYALTRGYIK
jgi:homoaconitase/3-isopropylmalate dehydratase large subunit